MQALALEYLIFVLVPCAAAVFIVVADFFFSFLVMFFFHISCHFAVVFSWCSHRHRILCVVDVELKNQRNIVSIRSFFFPFLTVGCLSICFNSFCRINYFWLKFALICIGFEQILIVDFLFCFVSTCVLNVCFLDLLIIEIYTIKITNLLRSHKSESKIKAELLFFRKQIACILTLSCFDGLTCNFFLLFLIKNCFEKIIIN